MIGVKNLTKRYGTFTAVSNLSFTIEPGHIYGFLGPNGAGKSTTMNMITGCLAPTEGEIKIDGFDIIDQPLDAKKRIGYLPEMPPLYADQTVVEYLTFVAEAKGFKGKTAVREEIERVIIATHIEDVAGKLIKHLSKGYKQRVGIAQALIGDPEIIILSSHILSEIQAVCDMVLIINRGEMLAFDKLENLTNLEAMKLSLEDVFIDMIKEQQEAVADAAETTETDAAANVEETEEAEEIEETETAETAETEEEVEA